MKKLFLALLLWPAIALGGTVSWLDGVSAVDINALTSITFTNGGCIKIDDSNNVAIEVFCLDTNDDLNIGNSTGVDEVNFLSELGIFNFKTAASVDNVIEALAVTGQSALSRFGGIDVGHAMTALAPADVWWNLEPISGTAGGAKLTVLSDGDAAPFSGLAVFGTADPTDTTPAWLFKCGKTDGSTGTDPLAAAETCFQVSDHDGVTDFLTIFGNGDLLLNSQTNDAVTPTLAFGDGDTGFYESADDVIRVAIAGSARFEFQSTGGRLQFGGIAVDSFALVARAATSTQSNIHPQKDDIDTGLGWAGEDQLSLIAGGVEGIRITATAATINETTKQVITSPHEYHRYVLNAQTTDATQTELFVTGTTGVDALAANEAAGFIILITARRSDADNEGAFYKVEGAVDNNAGTTALIGSVTVTTFVEDSAAWDVTVTADDPNNNINVLGTGEMGKTIDWTAKVEWLKAG